MAVEVSISNIGSGFNRTTINDNFSNIDLALQDALSRNGDTPNQMEADIDLNSNDLLNVGLIDTTRLIVDGVEFSTDDVTAIGPPGEDATVTLGSVSTGAAGSSVIITNTGTPPAAVLNFTIPRGDTGASGAGTGDMLAAQNLNDLASKSTAFSNIKQDATTSATGVVELATTTELLTGTDTTRSSTPDAIAALWEKGSDVASASTVSLGEGGFFHITGVTTITDIDFATAKNGRSAWVVFDGILTLTHNSTTLKLPGNANITTAAGDRAHFTQDNSDNIICDVYVKADGTPVVGSGGGWTTLATARNLSSGTTDSFTISLTGKTMLRIWLKGVSGSSAAANLDITSKSAITGFTSAGQTLNGYVEYDLLSGVGVVFVENSGTPSTNMEVFTHGVTTATTTITLSLSAGNFDAGTWYAQAM